MRFWEVLTLHRPGETIQGGSGPRRGVRIEQRHRDRAADRIASDTSPKGQEVCRKIRAGEADDHPLVQASAFYENEVAANAAGNGAVAGIGVGPDGEPPARTALGKRRKEMVKARPILAAGMFRRKP